MAPVLKVLEFLRKIQWIARDYIKRILDRGASLLASLARKLNTWCRFWVGLLGRPKLAERQFIGSKARSYSVRGGSATAGEYVAAASYVPASASHPSLHEHAESSTSTISPPGLVLDSIVVSHPHTTNPPHALGGGNPVNRSSGNLSAVVSIQSRASDRYSIITNSHESIRTPLGQPSRLRRATYPQFGCGLDQLGSKERATWPPTPTTRPHTHHPSRLDIITTLLSTRDDGKVGTVVQPLASSSYTHEPLGTPLTTELRRRRSSTSVVVEVQNPSTRSLPISFSTNPPQITDEPFAMDSSPDHSSPDSPAVDLHDEPLPRSPTSSDYLLPEGRFVQLINSYQIPRHAKNVTMQVDRTIPTSDTHTSCRPRVETAYYLNPLTTEFP